MKQENKAAKKLNKDSEVGESGECGVLKVKEKKVLVGGKKTNCIKPH